MSLCFFIGYRGASESVRPALTQAVTRHIEEYGVRNFIVGRYGNFDHMVWQVLAEAKKAHPDLDLNLRLAVAYPPEVLPVSLPRGFDSIYFPQEFWGIAGQTAILRLTQHLMNRATHIILYVNEHSVHSRKAVTMAEERARWRKLMITKLVEQGD